MSENPKCPNCGRLVPLLRTIPDGDPVHDEHVFGCWYCKLNYMTEDSTPIGGEPLPTS
jgi:hypothetical protein